MLKLFAPALLCTVFSVSAFASAPSAELIGAPIDVAQQKLVAMGYVESQSSEKDTPVFVRHTHDDNPMMQDTVVLKTLGDKKVAEVFFTSTKPMPHDECMKIKASSEIQMSCQENNVANMYMKF